MRFEFLATWPGAILAVGSQRVPLYAPRPGWRERITFAARRGAQITCPNGPNVRVFSLTGGFSGVKNKTRFYAGDLVAQGPSGAYGVGWMRRRGWVPDGLPDRSPDAARNHSGSGGWRDLRRPLKFPNLIVSLTRFGHVLEG